MSDSALGIIYSLIAALFTILGSISFLQRKNIRGAMNFSIVSLNGCVWALCLAIHHFVANMAAAAYIYELHLIGVAFLTAAYMCLTMRVTYNDSSLGPKLTALLCIVPFITSVLILVNPWLHLIRQNTVFELVGGSKIMVAYQYGAWFWVHSIYCYILMFAAGALILKACISLPASYRARMLMLLVLTVVTWIVNLLYVMDMLGGKFDYTLICTFLTCCLLFWMQYKKDGSDILFRARDSIYRYFSSMVFVLDKKRVVRDANNAATAALSAAGIDPFGMCADEIVPLWIERAGGRIFTNGSKIPSFCVLENGRESYYQVLESGILEDNTGGNMLGYCVEMRDVTKEHVLINELEKMADIDPLTGLYNRRRYLNCLQALNNSQKLPVGILYGDVNGLKRTNDKAGHSEGDRLLRLIASILKEELGPNAFLARIGGDEFVALLDNTDKYEIEQLIKHIHDSCMSYRDDVFGVPSIALGYAIKSSLSEDIDSLVKDADSAMYALKRRRNEAL